MKLAVAEHRNYRKLADYIREEWGIEFPSGKQVMVETRLGKRARALGLASLAEYYEYLLTGEGRAEEAEYLIDAITTHKTDFFREPAHFELLTSLVVPDLAVKFGAGLIRPLTVWCAASSTGEEPYTLAMVLAEIARCLQPRPFRFAIEATDISRVVLETGRMGVYPETAVAPVPDDLRARYLLRSRDRDSAQVRIVPQLRAAVRFRQLNLLDQDYGIQEPVDVVFCRNVMIYFDRPKQQQVLGRICRVLRPGGYLLMGHSESLSGLDLPVEQVAPTVHRRRHG